MGELSKEHIALIITYRQLVASNIDFFKEPQRSPLVRDRPQDAIVAAPEDFETGEPAILLRKESSDPVVRGG